MTKITNGGPKDLFPALLKDDPEQRSLSYAIERAVLLINDSGFVEMVITETMSQWE